MTLEAPPETHRKPLDQGCIVRDEMTCEPLPKQHNRIRPAKGIGAESATRVAPPLAPQASSLAVAKGWR